MSTDVVDTGSSAAPNSHDEPLPEGQESAPPGTRLMSVVRWLLILVMAAAAVAAWFSYWGISERLAARAGHAEASHATVYYCPMHPSVVQDHPGECPICSMTLVPKPDAAVAARTPPPGGVPTSEQLQRQGVPGLSPIDLPLERIQLLGMRTARVVRAPLAPSLRTVGYVAASESGLAKIETRFAGWIETLAVSQTGEHVTKGEVLATIYSPELLAAEQELVDAARWTREGAATDSHAHSDGQTPAPLPMTSGLADDARHRLELLGVAKADLDEIVRTGKPVHALSVRSPVAGYVTTKTAVAGLYVQPGTELFEIADLSTVWVLADLYEQDGARVHVGQHARFVTPALAGKKPLTGRVDFLYPTVDSASRTMRARVVLANPGLRLRPGMYGTVELDLTGPGGGVVPLAIPDDALVDTGEQQYVFVAGEGGHFEPRHVTVGAHAAGQVTILDGLTEGETVVTTANFLLDSESRLRSAIEGSSASGAASDEQIPIDGKRFPDKVLQWKQCERVHRGMGTMEDDCKNAIPKPWK